MYFWRLMLRNRLHVQLLPKNQINVFGYVEPNKRW